MTLFVGSLLSFPGKMAMYQNAQKVNVEFLKSSTLKGRIIKLNYTPAQVPAQLYGRVDLARSVNLCD